MLPPSKQSLTGFGCHLSSSFGIEDRIFVLTQLFPLSLKSTYQEKLIVTFPTLNHPGNSAKEQDKTDTYSGAATRSSGWSKEHTTLTQNSNINKQKIVINQNLWCSVYILFTLFQYLKQFILYRSKYIPLKFILEKNPVYLNIPIKLWHRSTIEGPWWN